MSRKHYGFFALCILLSSMVASLVYTLSLSEASGDSVKSGFRQMPVLAEIWVPDGKDIKAIRQLEIKLDDISDISKGDSSDPQIAFFQIQEKGQKQKSGKERSDSGIRPKRSGYIVSFAFVSGRKKFCMINKKLYTLFDTLPDGERIMEIKTDKVLIEKDERYMWIPMKRRSS